MKIATLLAILLFADTANARCQSDFNDDGATTIDEVLTMLGNAVNGCDNRCRGDFNNDDTVTVDEVLIGLNEALAGCVRTATPTRTVQIIRTSPTVTKSTTPTRTATAVKTSTPSEAQSVCGGALSSEVQLCDFDIAPGAVFFGSNIVVSWCESDKEGDIKTHCLSVDRLGDGSDPFVECADVEPLGHVDNDCFQTTISTFDLGRGLFRFQYQLFDRRGHQSAIGEDVVNVL